MRLEVIGCERCPFLHQEASWSGTPTRCRHPEARELDDNRIPELQPSAHDGYHRWSFSEQPFPAPEWCPLRLGPLTVVFAGES